ncbi:OLC1v1020327C2 [Oldenlandia corymbosa var. corymbosa]|uniref:OLC1v1020327C2 n=1 Tax=Oldenlandia corymbosa var. corymbosa TaxID=529605 RepID=A0AAV1EGA4_OLDCO|nr:OLC1v1020327C2 [Oldenlandia corymbosa var. corymbosa]
MKRQLILAQDSLPDDVALSIMKFLEVSDVCSLGSCSKFWREISTSECLWKHLCQLRWPGIVLEDEIEAEIHDHDQPKMPSLKGWRGLYVKKHNLMAEKAAVVRKSLSCSEIDVNMYHKALEDMKRMQFGFKDVQMFFLKSGINVLLNFVGLHYCIKELGVQVTLLSLYVILVERVDFFVQNGIVDTVYVSYHVNVLLVIESTSCGLVYLFCYCCLRIVLVKFLS